ncbi:MAG: hypothetical protein J5696_05825 [Lachnospiraceae bacterium]|nr:hypothetical protein [Lachnospiraceae bacterium]
MFNCMFLKYKIEVLNVDLKKLLSRMHWYEIVGVLLMVAGAIAFDFFLGLLNFWGSCISFGGIFIGIVFLVASDLLPKLKKRKYSERTVPYAYERMDDMIKLLKTFDIDPNDKDQVNLLIETAKKERITYDVWGGFRGVTKGIFTYVIIPIVAVLIANLFEDTKEISQISYALFVVLCGLACVVIVYAVVSMFKGLFNADIKKLDYFIEDLEDLLVFKTLTKKETEKLNTSSKEKNKESKK